MIAFMWNLLLALIWVVLTGDLSGYNLLAGMIVGYLVLGLMQRQIPVLRGYTSRLPRLFRFICFFIKELIMANLKVGFDIVTPIWHMKPGVIAMPLDAKTDMEITMVANLISLTPGTLSLDVSDDRRVLFIHAMFLDDEPALRASLKEMERRALEILR
ncbi:MULTISPECIES: Na+/H+ antiporter subunit E [Nitrincola]|uniref:Multiple resistance and pH homeostasis protein E n=1 Tax=Nitrincola nitratireducens TaxID=1229521 RepID=W9V062_9GAMM|nr:MULTISPECIES: Na+/H+ antiporter subunit E [Nitrincola]EXJ12853.1 Multiple resistance and pH homeostasis protein E [Nitrincola nitratireducens]